MAVDLKALHKKTKIQQICTLCVLAEINLE